MPRKKNRTDPSWRDVKARLAELDRAGLLGLVQDLYSASKENKAFLHARFQLGEDPLEPYKATIDRWIWPDWLRDQDASVSKARKAISDYRKALGDPEGIAELTVFYCERATGYASEVGGLEEGYFVALVRMFGEALEAVAALPGECQTTFRARLERVHRAGHEFGYGVGFEMDDLRDFYGFHDET